MRFLFLATCVAILLPVSAWAQSGDTESSSTPASARADASAPTTVTVTCQSRPSARTSCPANASSGAVLIKSTGTETCLLGKNWGYDTHDLWVSDGCGGEFLVGAAIAQAAAQPPAQTPRQPADRIETWGELDPGAR